MTRVGTTPEHEIKLGFGMDTWFGLIGAGACGVPVACTWYLMLTLPFTAMPGENEPTFLGVLGIIAMMLGLFGMLFGPFVIAPIILQARQPRGARITWDDDTIIEWDGPDQRTVIPWKSAEAFELEWLVHLKSHTYTERALQLFDPNTKNAITVWGDRPETAPRIRRRMQGDVKKLRNVIQAHAVKFSGAPDWSRACESGRPAYPKHFLWSRLGYVAAMLGPLVMKQSGVPGLALCALAVGLLWRRAQPVLAEFRELQSRGSPWDQRKLRAVRAEAFVRSSFVVFVIYSAWASWMFLRDEKPAPPLPLITCRTPPCHAPDGGSSPANQFVVPIIRRPH